MDTMPTLPICRYHFDVIVRENMTLPALSGSMLRGVFGKSLREISCMTGLSNCADCPLRGTCTYPAVFETPAAQNGSQQSFTTPPNPYVIEPPGRTLRLQAGDRFRFSMVLFGSAIRHLSLITLAWERALLRGLGPERIPCQLDALHREQDSEPVYRPGQGSVDRHEPADCNPPQLQHTVTLEFITPLRLQRQGRALSAQQIDARSLLISLARRYQFLLDHHVRDAGTLDFSRLAEAATDLKLQSDMRWRDAWRYSGRQRRKIPIGGLLGTVELQGELSVFSQLLGLGRWLHVGKETVFGLGHYRILATGDCKA